MNTVLGATVGVLLVLLLVTVVALVNTCVALRLKNKQRYVEYAPYNNVIHVNISCFIYTHATAVHD